MRKPNISPKVWATLSLYGENGLSTSSAVDAAAVAHVDITDAVESVGRLVGNAPLKAKVEKG